MSKVKSEGVRSLPSRLNQLLLKHINIQTAFVMLCEYNNKLMTQQNM